MLFSNDWFCITTQLFILLFIEQANQFHPSIKFTDEISESEITFLDTIIYKGNGFQTDSILDIKTDRNLPIHEFHLLPPSGRKTTFYQRRSDKTPKNKLFTNHFWRVPLNFKLRLKMCGYPNNFIERSLTGVRFEDRRLALQQRKKT